MTFGPLVGYTVAVMSTVTATAAMATAGFAWKTWQSVERHERALYGAESIDRWDGIVPTVAEHEEALDEEGLL